MLSQSGWREGRKRGGKEESTAAAAAPTAKTIELPATSRRSILRSDPSGLQLCSQEHLDPGPGAGVGGGDRDERAGWRDGPAERAATDSRRQECCAEERREIGRASRRSLTVTMEATETTAATTAARSCEREAQRRWSSILESRWRFTRGLALLPDPDLTSVPH